MVSLLDDFNFGLIILLKFSENKSLLIIIFCLNLLKILIMFKSLYSIVKILEI